MVFIGMLWCELGCCGLHRGVGVHQDVVVGIYCGLHWDVVVCIGCCSLH